MTGPANDNRYRPPPTRLHRLLTTNLIDSLKRNDPWMLRPVDVLALLSDREGAFEAAERMTEAERFPEAFRLYVLAAQQGRLEAVCRLGWCFQHGHGIPRQRNCAARMYRLASLLGHPPAQACIGLWLTELGYA